MAFEDAGALGYIYHRGFDTQYTIAEGLSLYERLRKPRATRIQDASFRARENLNERIGWSSGTDRPGKLTIEEVCGYDMQEHLQQLMGEVKSVASL